ncbi:N-acetylmuramoyl-L-alanine amidase [Selenomonas sp.]|uniref:N-acetylmuramoyl-L-alanine amidase n=1 Tax=Selenomonas sp. TaxID=2053611 RepID=UPI0025D0E8C5|nr:N-acetylmuramoyl-L-alanine amidase [Selenomonas sp.]
MILRLIMMMAAVFMILLQPACAGASAFGDKVANLAEIKNIRVGITSERVRIVVDADKEVDYSTMVLSNPGRVVVDLSGAWLSPGAVRSQTIDSTFASKVRAAQFDKTTVRIVIETDAKKGGFDVFSVEGGPSPYRVVMDFGKISAGEKAEPKKPAAEPKNEEESEVKTDETEKETEPVKEKETPAKTEEKKEEVNIPEEDPDEIEEPEFSGLKGKKICIDPGHGGEDPGAIGPSGITEKSITLKIGKEVKRLLEEAGAKVIMTRTTDTEVSPKHKQATDVDELQARCDVANKAKADAFVSIHMDSFSSRSANGTTGYYYIKGSASSRRLAAAIQKNLVKQISTESRGVKTCNFYVVKHTNMPATLIEVAFVSNPKEEKRLYSDAGAKKAAIGIVQGISDFFDK